MKLRIRDPLVYWFHRGLASLGKIHPPTLEEIQKGGFQRVLVAATTAIGDAVLCAPLLDSLRKARPDLKMGFMVPAAAVPLFEGKPGLDFVLPYHGKYRKVGPTLEILRDQNYDLALVANANDPDVIPLIWWGGCRRIIRRPQRNTIYLFMIANPEMLSPAHTTGHAIERNLEFCDLLKIPRGEPRTRLETKPATESRLDETLKDIPSPWICIHPGSAFSKKQWGADRFAELGRRILEKKRCSLLITGSVNEKSICRQVAENIENPSRIKGHELGGRRVFNLAGKLPLDEFAALLKKARLLISGDTGPYHIAMALGTPTVTLFASWDPGSSSAINGPYFDKEKHLTVETLKMGDPISTIKVGRVLEVSSQFV